MPNTSFRVASWALLISVGLCVVAASTNTRNARLALSYPPKTLAPPEGTQLAGQSASDIELGTSRDFPGDRAPEIAVRVASRDPFALEQSGSFAGTASQTEGVRGPDVVVPDPYEHSPLDPIDPLLTSERPAAEVASRDETLTPWSGSTAAPAAAPRARIASADPDLSFGQFPAWAQSEAHGVYEELPPPPAETAEAQKAETAPEESQLKALRDELAALRATRDTLESSVEPSPVESAIPKRTETFSPIPARLPPQFEPAPLRVSPAPPAPVQTPAQTVTSLERDGISISAGQETDRWNLQFQQASVRDVLMTVGEMIGWQVVIDPNVDGEFTSTFTEADLEQSFAVVVKAHRLRVERRGDYILIGTRP